MAEVEIPIFNGVYRNIDESVANDKNWDMIDAILDVKEKNICTRPGVDQIMQLGALVSGAIITGTLDGMYWWDSQQKLIMISNGDFWYSDDLVNAYGLNTGSNTFQKGKRPTFAVEGSNIYIANGGRIIKWDTSGSPAALADGDAPTEVTHIAILDSYLIANQVNSNVFKFSDAAAPSSWSALSFASTDAKPDVVSAMHVFRDEVFFLGKESVEVWEDDGMTPFSRVNGGTLPVGCLAPYSVVESDNSLIFLDNRRKFVRVGGGQIEHLECPYEDDLEGWLVTDCLADRWDILGKTLFVFQFIAEGITIYFNETDNNWGRFGYWNSAGGFYEAFIGSCHAYDPVSKKHFIGSRRPDGYVYLMSPDYSTDEGNPIRMVTTTGHVNYGTNREKISRELSFSCERGGIQDSSEPVCFLRVNDDKQGWSNEIQISLGQMGQYYGQISLPKMGRFRTRQYEFACSDPVKFVFSQAKEDLVVV